MYVLSTYRLKWAREGHQRYNLWTSKENNLYVSRVLTLEDMRFGGFCFNLSENKRMIELELAKIKISYWTGLTNNWTESCFWLLTSQMNLGIFLLSPLVLSEAFLTQ